MKEGHDGKEETAVANSTPYTLHSTLSKLNINQWAIEDRPREKLERLGPQALSDAELLAILVGSGSAKEDAVSLMKRILGECHNNLNTLGKLTINDLCRYNGVGPAKAITILAACELGKRRQAEKPEERPELGTATRIYRYMHPLMQDLDVEEFWVLLMNQNYRLIKKVRLSHGGITETSVDIRIMMREAVLANCTILAVCHNHPSGNLKPSKCDNDLTKSIKRACELMRIHFLDHVIITDGQYYSYHELGEI
jgi:DNA repair protein RadC